MDLERAQQQVREFMELSLQTTPDKFTELTKDEAVFRYGLIHEEVVEELLATLGGAYLLSEDKSVTGEQRDAVYAELMDAVVDSLYVILGLPIAMGLDVKKYFDEAHRSNMTKFVEGLDGNFYPIKNADGKTIKPKTFDPPRFLDMIKEDIHEETTFPDPNAKKVDTSGEMDEYLYMNENDPGFEEK